MSRFYLNALRPDQKQLAQPEAGKWHEDPNFLSGYVTDIDLQGQLSNITLSHSVPSAFQRPIQFYRALSDPNSPLHSAVTAEWRGLMAVFCLSSWLEVRLDVPPFAVPHLSERKPVTWGMKMPATCISGQFSGTSPQTRGGLAKLVSHQGRRAIARWNFALDVRLHSCQVHPAGRHTLGKEAEY